MFGNLSLSSAVSDIDYLDTFIIQTFIFFIVLLGFYPHLITHFIYLDSFTI